MNYLRKFCFLLLSILVLSSFSLVHAQERFEGRITTLQEEGAEFTVTIEPQGGFPLQTVIDTTYLQSNITLLPDRSYVFERYPDGGIHVLDVVRRPALLILFALFLVVTLFVAGWKGVRSLVGMILSFAVMIGALLPALLGGANPVLATILTSLVLVPITFFLSHGWNTKTIAAVVGTVVALLVTGILTLIFSDLAWLTGFASEEVTFLEVYFPEGIQAKGLLLAGMIIGLLGILDDVTITQAAVTIKLKDANPSYTRRMLIQKSLDIGKDHIASVVNTLILVYVGSSLPLLLLFMNDAIPWMQVLNSEIVAEEVVRTLVGSIGLILAVPLTTLVTIIFLEKYTASHDPKDDFGCGHVHH